MFRARRHVAWGGIIRGSVDHPLHNSAYGLSPSITWTPAWKPKHSHNCHLRCRLWKCCKHSEEARRNPRRRFAGSDIFGEFVLWELKAKVEVSPDLQAAPTGIPYMTQIVLWITYMYRPRKDISGNVLLLCILEFSFLKSLSDRQKVIWLQNYTIL